VTEAGPPPGGLVKGTAGIGTLLAEGIGDTIRVSLSADPVEEPKTAYEILKALGLRERGPVMIACPSCGRDNVGVHTLAEEVEERLREYPQAFEVAVLGMFRPKRLKMAKPAALAMAEASAIPLE